MQHDSFLSPSTRPRPTTLLLAGTAATAVAAAPGLLASTGQPELAIASLGGGMATGGVALVRYLLRDRRR